MSELKELQEKVVEFRDKRDWRRYHDPKNLCISISIESAELLELFQWKNEAPKQRMKEEMADVMIYILSLADVAGIDLKEAVLEKIKMNRKKYPADDSKSF